MSAAAEAKIQTPEEIRAYKRTLAFLLAAAAESFPELGSINIMESIGSSLVFSFDAGAAAAESAVQSGAIADRVKALIAQNAPIVQKPVARSAIIGGSTNIKSKVTLDFVRGISDEFITCHAIALDNGSEFIAVSHGNLQRNSGEAGACEFAIESVNEPYPHFRLHHSVINHASKALELIPVHEPKLMEAFATRKSWGEQLGLRTVTQINRAISESRTKSLVQLSEALHDHQITSIASKIAGGGVLLPGATVPTRLVLIAGPSSSGKTTFAKRLCVALETLCVRPVVVSVDSYYKAWQEIDSRGMQYVDWESLDSLNVSLLNDHLQALLAGEEVMVPEYDMKTSMPMSKDHWVRTKLPEGGIIIMEGIHCLNPALTPRVAKADKFQIMISPISALTIDNLNILSSSQVRMMRRMVRDYLFRGRAAQSTLRQWPSVALGERTNIYPNQNNADVVMNSALAYEAHVLKVYAEPLLTSITPDMAEYTEARRLLSLLQKLTSMPDQLVPPQSLLREFVGGSWFYEYGGLYKSA